MRCPKNHSTETVEVIHPPTLTGAEDWKRWVLVPYFDNKWRKLGLTDDDLRALQIMVMMRPKAFPVVAGTGGLRKVRFARVKSDAGQGTGYQIGGGGGKSGGFRIGYAYFEEFGVIVAITVYAKKDQDDISHGQRAEIKKMIERLYRWVADGG